MYIPNFGNFLAKKMKIKKYNFKRKNGFQIKLNKKETVCILELL